MNELTHAVWTEYIIAEAMVSVHRPVHSKITLQTEKMAFKWPFPRLCLSFRKLPERTPTETQLPYDDGDLLSFAVLDVRLHSYHQE